MTGSDHPTADDYRLLGLHPGASLQEVKRAYRESAKRWHPDRYAGVSDWERARAEEKFKDLQDAYRRILASLSPGGFSEREAAPDKKATGRPAPNGARSPSREKEPFSRPGSDKTGEAASPWEKRWFEASARLVKSLGSGKRAAAAAVLLLAALWGYWVHERHSKDVPLKTVPAAPAVSVPNGSQASSGSDLLARVEEALSSPRAIPGQERRGGQTPGEAPAGPAGKSGTFTLGSSEKDVLGIQGPPDKAGGGRWAYGLSEVRFKDGRVSGYDNFDGRLRVSLLPSAEGSHPGSGADFFTLGSSKDEVLRVQGTPTSVRGSVWHYGFGSVRFSEDRVVSFDNSFGNLKVRLEPSREYLEKTGGRTPSFFTIGSSADEVLAVQGTPTSVRGNLWFYDFSDVLFRDGRVGWVNDPGGRLRFVPKEALSEEVPVNPR
ncbi:MAG: J domain-containing protein [Desulfosoma sp.]